MPEQITIEDISATTPTHFEVEGTWFAVIDTTLTDSFLYLVIQQEGSQAKQATYVDMAFLNKKSTYQPDIIWIQLQAAAKKLLDKAASAKVKEIADRGVGG